MATFINDIHDLVNLLTGKGQTGYHSPEQIDLAVHTASKEMFAKEYEQYSMTQKISDDLMPFLISSPLTLNGSGIANKPADYLYFSSLRSGTNQIDVDVIDDAMWGKKMVDPICPPEANYPVCLFDTATIKFLPINLTAVNLRYFKVPAKPVWAYNIVNNREVYDEGTTVDIEWNPMKQTQITFQALSYLGINLREDDLIKYSEMQKTQS